MSPGRAVEERDFSLTSLIPGVFLPTVVYEIGIGAILPVIAVTSRELGGSLATAGLVVALLGVGLLIGDLPAGVFAARVGERRAMLVAALATVVTVTGAALAPNLVVLGAAVTVTGAIGSVFLLARQTYLTEVTPVLRRARALSTLAGVQRFGTFLGPFIGALVIHLTSSRGAYWFAVAMSLATALIVWLVPDVPGAGSRADRVSAVGSRRTVTASMWSVAQEHRRVLVSLGTAVLLVGVVRGARATVIPLWGEHLGLDPATTSLLFGISGAVDMTLFYVSGKVMDRYGRLWAAVPSMGLMCVTLAVLPFAGTAGQLAVVAVVLGLGNGFGSGILMTLGSDVAPPGVRAQFLAIWRLIADSGQAAGPLVIAAGAAAGSIAVGVWAVAGLAAGSVGALLRWVPRWTEHANGTTRRRAAERRAAS